MESEGLETLKVAVDIIRKYEHQEDELKSLT